MSERPSQQEIDEANASHIQELTDRITELETANKGLQIALLDANEKEKELQLHNAMLLIGLNVANNDSKLWDGHEGRYSKIINATPAQSATWIENRQREKDAQICDDMALYTGIDCAAAIRANK